MQLGTDNKGWEMGMRAPFGRRFWPLVLVWSVASFGLDALRAEETPLTAQAQFQKSVRPFIETYCIDCHNPEKKKGKLTLHDLSGTITKEGNADLWATILDQLVFDEMPPEKAKNHPEGAERKVVTDWIRSELGHAGFERDPDLLRRPEFGNLIDHEKLFGGGIKTASYSVPRVWRLRAELVPMGSPFALSEFDYSAMQDVGEPETLRLRGLSEEIAAALVEYALGHKTRNRNHRLNPEAIMVYQIPEIADPEMYTGKGALDRKSIESDIGQLFTTFLHRDPTEPEMTRYANFLEGMLETDPDREAALATVIRALILTPEAIYRMELGMGETLPDGRRMLGEQELSFALPMSLGKNTPVTGLKTREDVEQAVRSILAKDRAVKRQGSRGGAISPRFIEFMRQYFGYGHAPDVFKGDRHAWHQHVSDKGHTNAYRLAEDTDKIVISILREDQNVFERLLTTDQIVVNRRDVGENFDRTMEYFETDWQWKTVPRKEADRKTFLASRQVFKVLSYLAYYNLEGDGVQAKEVPLNELVTSPVPRAGILTQPSWLIAHSTFTDNHVVRRGKWIREKLLGGSIPEVPIGVDAFIPDDDDVPLRKRHQSTTQEFCWRCHHRMDPLGYPFEIYDDFGRYRVEGRERLINGKFAEGRVDTSGAIIDSGVPGLDGPVKDAVVMIQKIAKTDRARQVFVRHAFRFFMGRNETLNDAQSLIAADKAYVDSGGSFEELVVSILTSDSFLYRKIPGSTTSTSNP